MKRILVYGDSNSWGFPADGSGQRYVRRWPVVMAEVLRIELVEDCLPARSTVHNHPDYPGEMMNGLAHLPVALKSQSPVHGVVLMLGTNDLQVRYEPEAGKIAENIGRLVDCIRAVGGGLAGWYDETAPAVAMIIPPLIPEAARNRAFEDHEKWLLAPEVSLQLGAAVRSMAQARAVPVFDAGAVIEGAASDPIHWTGESQTSLGLAVGDWLQGVPGFGAG
ncbi:GDSL-type esterase/lipase family protein [Candidatus Halocynthiibacter alkanivorans]|uniref:GDSL-type esterase/lipase family protein n=1 Tax=Candidatus Halocynthiibacter alkanivorans TaxID=2267619 RepID=UPI000DF200DA|nr:GDSL-type esterase/lipase family protein [Candidatus Halocynthiibacter alkanivorans]